MDKTTSGFKVRKINGLPHKKKTIKRKLKTPKNYVKEKRKLPRYITFHRKQTFHQAMLSDGLRVQCEEIIESNTNCCDSAFGKSLSCNIKVYNTGEQRNGKGTPILFGKLYGTFLTRMIW